MSSQHEQKRTMEKWDLAAAFEQDNVAQENLHEVEADIANAGYLTDEQRQELLDELYAFSEYLGH